MIGLHVPVIPPAINILKGNRTHVCIPFTNLTLSNAARSPQWKLVPGGIQRPFLLLFPWIIPTKIPRKNIITTSLFIVVVLFEMEIKLLFKKIVIMPILPIMSNVFNVHSQ